LVYETYAQRQLRLLEGMPPKPKPMAQAAPPPSKAPGSVVVEPHWRRRLLTDVLKPLAEVEVELASQMTWETYAQKRLRLHKKLAVREGYIDVIDYLGGLGSPTAQPRAKLAVTGPQRPNSQLQPRAADGVSLDLGQYLQRVGEPRSARFGGGSGGGAVQRAGAAGFTSGSFELAQHGSTLDIFEHLASLPVEGSVAASGSQSVGRVHSWLQPRAADGAREHPAHACPVAAV
jgi:hypothetical protein